MVYTKMFCGDGVVRNENMITISAGSAVRMKKSRFVLKKKGFIFSAVVKGEEKC